MLIHAYRRQEPIEVELFGLKLEFKPNDFKHCVAEVTHAAAIERLLSIPEGYVEYGQSAAAAPAQATAKVAQAAEPMLIGSKRWDAEIELAEDRFVAQADVVQAAFERTGLTMDQWNAQSDDTIDGLLGAEIQALKAGLQRSDEDDEAEEERERQESARALAEAEALAKAEAAVAEQTGGTAVANPLVLTNGDTTIDLSTYTAKQVRAMAAENKIDLPGGNSTPVAELRLLLAKGLKGE